jgi:hypothetical protein
MSRAATGEWVELGGGGLRVAGNASRLWKERVAENASVLPIFANFRVAGANTLSVVNSESTCPSVSVVDADLGEAFVHKMF